MPGIELMKKVRDHIKAFPEQHEQDSWHCETSACIAGHAALMEGCTLSEGGPHLELDGQVVAAEGFARTQMGLTPIEADYLFYCMDNDVAVQRLDQLIELRERGEEFDKYTHWIPEESEDTAEYYCCEGCG